ncbi:MAG TPA: hypothetical protein DCM68_01385 [Verrucomicrobia bacterium]|nr:hypothetical protein [Verrucomicrobiota bacterium]
MKRIFLRSLAFCLLVALVSGAYVGWRAYGVFHTAYGGFKHLRYLLESGETVEGQPADEVLSDNYLLSLFGDNPELVERLKTVVDLGMATDSNLKLGNVSAMIVTYRKGANNEIMDAAIYAVGGFPDPKSKRLGFHSTGFFREEIDSALWLTGNAFINLLGRDIIVFCEQDKAEAHMALLYDLLNGGIMPLAQRIVDAPLHYAIVFPDPKELAPPNLRNILQTVIIKGEMSGDTGKTEMMLVSANPRGAGQVHTITKDMASLARITFHDKFGGYIKQMPWGPMNDTWWSVEYVKLIDSLQVLQDQVLVVVRIEYDRIKNNAILKTIERAGRDIAMQKSFSLAGELPWEFAYREKDNPSGGYWSPDHRWGPEWPLGDEGIPTPGSIAAAAERERIRAEQEAAAAAERERREKEQQKNSSKPVSQAT